MDPDELYGLPLDRFIAERTALAKALRADKRRDEAAEVAALRKPSTAAWATNQLVRTQRRAVQALFDAGDALRDAQSDLLAGRGDGRTLRAANERERAAVDELVQAARGLLSGEGYELSAAVVERVSDTLHAAALDEDAREQVRDGRLEHELRHVGLGLGEAPAEQAAPPAKAKKARTTAKGKAKKRTPAEAKSDRDQAAKERAEAERAERERSAARKASRAAEAKAKRASDRAAQAVQVAEERREHAAQALEEADEELASARAEAEAADDALSEARAALDDA